jgi:peptide/nickel transport system ATP-binding protein
VSEIAIEAEALTRTFTQRGGAFSPRRSLQALRGVSLTVRRGEALAIVGESGSGKTTLGNLLTGLDTPTSGEVRLAGTPVQDLPRLERAMRIQPIFQNPTLALNPRRNIEDILAEPLVVHGIGSSAERTKRVAQWLDLTGLPGGVAKSRPDELSGGQRQRVAIARALILGAGIIVCDEPTSALDVSVQAQILNLLSDLRKELSLTLVFITHDLSIVEFLCERMAVMYLGEIVEEGATERALKAPAHPYTRLLRDAMLTVDANENLPVAPPDAPLPSPFAPPMGCGFHPRCAFALEICRREPPPRVAGETIAACHRAGVLAP